MTSNLDEGQRKIAKNRRIASLFKQAKELSILCGVLVALIIFSPGETIPIMWPNETDVKVILTRYLCYSEDEKSKQLVDHKTYLSEKLEERKQSIKKIEQENEEKKIKIIFNKLFKTGYNLYELDAREIKGLLKLFALTQAKLDKRKKQLNQQSMTSQPPLLLSNLEQQTEDDVGQSSDFHVGGASTSLVDRSGARCGSIEGHDDRSY